MAGEIFINYRRGDDPGFAGRLYDHLLPAFSEPNQLFMDVDDIRFGDNFVSLLAERVSQCDVFLAVIGKNWLDARDETGQRRLDKDDDFVRTEIESALRHKKHIIPVLVNGAVMPRGSDLPETIRQLVELNAVPLTHLRFRAETDGLIKHLKKALEDAEATRLHLAAAEKEREHKETQLRQATPDEHGFTGALRDLRDLYGTLDRADDATLCYRYDYSNPAEDYDKKRLSFDENGSFWLDYLGNAAGTFPSAYSMPFILAEDAIDVPGVGRLRHGDILVLGGGQVDPNRVGGSANWFLETLSRWQPFVQRRRLLLSHKMRNLYKEQLLQNFNWAYTSISPSRKLFAIPGFGDRFDGLTMFDTLFCSSRGSYKGNVVGGWECQQHRSYWALRLPYRWWIWGVDVPFDEVLDSAQVDYFEMIAQQMDPNDSLIIMLSDPAWHIADERGTDEEENLFKLLAIARKQGVRVVALVASGAAHYSRYYAHELDVHLINSGGGGAFVGPTHNLRNSISLHWPERGEIEDYGAAGIRPLESWKAKKHDISLKRNTHSLTPVGSDIFDPVGEPEVKSLRPLKRPLRPSAPKCYPSKATSRWILLKSVLLPYYSPWSTVVLAAPYLATAFLLHSVIGDYSPRAIVQGLPKLLKISPTTLGGTAAAFLVWVFLSFSVAAVYAQVPDRLWRIFRAPFKIVLGGLHSMLHFGGVVLLMSGLTFLLLGNSENASWRNLAGSSESAITIGYWAGLATLGGIVGSALLGTYWNIASTFVRTHSKEAYTALKVLGYRSCLRFRFDRDGLTIFPLGVDAESTKRSWRKPRAGETTSQAHNPQWTPYRPISVHLIESPIVIPRYDEIV